MKGMLLIMLLLAFPLLVTGTAVAGAPLQGNPPGNNARQSATGIEEYYEKALKVDDDSLPEGLRVAPWGTPNSRTQGAPMITSPCLRFDSGEFARLLFTSPSGRRIRELLAENGVNADKVANLFKVRSVRGHEIVSVYDEGYMVLTDQNRRTNYIFPIAKGLGQTLFVLSQ